MSLFSGEAKPDYVALIVIGSGSVLVSIISSHDDEVLPKILWSKREMIPIKQNADTIPVKPLMTSLLNAVLLIDGVGVKTLRELHPGAKINAVQISYCAPWSFTVTKKIDYSEPETFTITTELLKNLVSTLEKKIDEERVEAELANHHGLSIMNNTLSGLTVNGYKTRRPLGQTVSALALIQTTDLTASSLFEAVIELQQKILPRLTPTHHTFIHQFADIMSELTENLSDYCLVHLTYEATEIGVVRNDTLEYVTYVPVGINTLVRGYAEALSIPHEEAYSFMREPYHSHALKNLSATKQKLVSAVTDAYKTELAKLFRENTDRLSIPRDLIIHHTQEIDSFIHVAIAESAQSVTQTTHIIHDTQDFLQALPSADPTIISNADVSITAYHYHTKHKHTSIISL